ncbi:MAG: ABC transporter substrate-binding protein [Planctomycetaceae bacterium]
MAIVYGLLIAAALPGCSGEGSSPAGVPRNSIDTAKDLTPGSKPILGDSPGATATVEAAVRRSKTLGGVSPAKSDTLLWAYYNDPDTINALTGNDTVGNEFQQWVYEGLAESSFADPDVLQPSLAEGWDFDKETLTYTIRIRKGVKWHPMRLPNGKPLPNRELTAKDVKFTFDCILNPNVQAASLRSYYEDPDATDASQKYKIKVTLVDDYTVKVKWTKPYFLADEFTLAAFAIIPRHVYSVNENGEPISFDFSSKEFAEGFNNHWANRAMCGTGPLMFKEWKKEQRLVLERNPDYWAEPFYFSQVIFRCIPNPNTVREQALQTELDWAIVPEKNLYLEGKESPSVKSGKVVPVEFIFPAYRYIGYNLKRDFFKDKRVRWALSHAIPVQQIIDVVFKGLAERTTGPTLLGSSSYDASIPEVTFDLDRAAKLLSEAGWEATDASGVRSKVIDDERVPARFDLMIYSDSPGYLTVAEIIKENCRKIGVEVQISPAKWALLLQKLRQKEFDACMLGWGMSWKQDLFQIWDSSQADLPDSSNSIGYANPAVDKTIAELRVTMDKAKQIELYHRLHRLIYDDQPYTFLFLDKRTGFRDARLENIKYYRVRPGIDGREWFASAPRELAN